MTTLESNTHQPFKEYAAYKWHNSCNIPVEISCTISRLEFPIDMQANAENVPVDLFINAQIICNQIPFHDFPISTYFGNVDEEKNLIFWEDLLTFPINIRDLSHDSILVLTAWSGSGILFGGTTLKLFDENGCLKRGKQKLAFYFNQPGDTNVISTKNTTPANLHEMYSNWDFGYHMEKHLETYRHGNGNDPMSSKKIDWLDRLTLERIEAALAEILHEERPYPSVTQHTPLVNPKMIAVGCVTEEDNGNLEFIIAGRHFNPQSICVVADWDIDTENLAEKQYRALAHDTVRGGGDPKVKPNLQDKEQIERLVQMAGDQLTDKDRDLLYKFRYALTDNKRALVKLLLSIDWDNETEVAELPTVLQLWRTKAPIDISDALKMLGGDKAFQNPTVRQYAVDTLQSASDDELHTYLLQLVQALRYEPENGSTSKRPQNAAESTDAAPLAYASTGLSGPELAKLSTKIATTGTSDILSPLANFLITRASVSPFLANSLYWFLKVETGDTAYQGMFEYTLELFLNRLKDHCGPEGLSIYKQLVAQDEYIGGIIKCQQDAKEVSGAKPAKEAELRKLLAERNMNKIPPTVSYVPSPLNPSIKLIGLNPSTARMFKSAVYPCVIEFDVLPAATAARANKRRKSGFGTNMWMAGGENRQSAVQQDDDEPVSPVAERRLLSVNAPSSPTVQEKAKIMFKCGDDLRQDQLIMQLMELMDGLLKKVNINLKLLTYHVLAVTQNDGIMEFVQDSHAFSAVLEKYKTVQNFLKTHNPDPKGDYEIAPAAMDTFVKSCAASCVVTYILGIGDRHLDNIMMTTKGQLFHIDFGFIFGQDPKPLPPPFRFTREMADGMGGEDSEHYAKFKGYCCQAYNWLRKSASLILNLLSLMGDAGIEDISVKSNLSKVLVKVEEKFRLDLPDEMAEQHFLGLINESLNAIAPRVMEVFHKIAVARR